MANSFEKQPSETFGIEIEFAGQLPSGRSLASGTISVVNLTAGGAENAVVSSTTATISGTKAQGVVTGGTAGHKYRITFLVTLDNTHTLEEDLFLYVGIR